MTAAATNLRACWLCGADLVPSIEAGRTLICPLHSTRGAAHLRNPVTQPRPDAQPARERVEPQEVPA